MVTSPPTSAEIKEESDHLIFKCNCGAIQATLKGKPVQNVNCHCRSCVSSARYIEAKPEFDGTSMLAEGGVAHAFFRWSSVKFITPDNLLSEDARGSFGFVKVGVNGKMVRSYCVRCGTMLGGFSVNNAGLNRNAIFKKDGSPYTSVDPVSNIMCKFAFDPSSIPEPRYSIVPLGMVLSLVPNMLGFTGTIPKKCALFPADMSKAEVVPITWE